MAKKKRTKNPFRHYSVKQVERAEATSYFMVVGEDVFKYANQMVFSEEDIRYHYANITKYFKEVIEEGTPEISKQAVKTLLTIKIFPLRIN